MSWRQPSDHERRLVADFYAHSGETSPLARLARLLAPATRIEPLLLRNARMRFLPATDTEIESLFWFSRLVAARDSNEVVFHSGVSRLLAGELQRDAALFTAAVEFIERHSAHWLPEDRLEQTMRLATLRPPAGAADPALHDGLRDLLQLIAGERDEKRRVRLARSIRQTLVTIGSDRIEPLDELCWLRQYLSCRLGTTAQPPGESRAADSLPAWLGEPSTTPAPHFERARIAIRVHYDRLAGRVVLHIREAGEAAEMIELPTPLPADLHVECPGAPGRWHVLAGDDRLPLPLGSGAGSLAIVLTTIDGRRHRLETRLPGDRPPPPRLLLAHLAEDREHARAIADWLRRQGIGSELIEEAATATTAARGEEAEPPLPVLRLWTPAARRRQQESPGDFELPAERSALLRIDPAVELPPRGDGAEKVLELRAWDEDQPAADDFLRELGNWLNDTDGNPPPPPGGGAIDAEVARLLAELDDPATTPPRRRAIGDRLAEIGDPRPGVGVREVEIDEPSEAESAKARKASGEVSPAGDDEARPEAERLLAELDDPWTIPPRRLAIGDRLAEIGDPRPGVGLDARGLPEIDWVEIPGGEFLYQNGEKRSLPTFWIARYPVTNAQFQAFLDAGGYGKAKNALWENLKRRWQGADWWRDLRKPEPEPSRWPQANRPRTNVDWYEAVAFTRWLGAQLGREVRLPTEEEWERAARGRDGREYPWGNLYESSRANIDETWQVQKVGEWHLRETTAVGVYPHGASPEGVLDLTGNVWEWCLNKYDDPKQTRADTSGDSRVLRGGSWFSHAGLARASRRFWNHPGSRSYFSGFRLVSSSPIA